MSINWDDPYVAQYALANARAGRLETKHLEQLVKALIFASSRLNTLVDVSNGTGAHMRTEECIVARKALLDAAAV